MNRPRKGGWCQSALLEGSLSDTEKMKKTTLLETVLQCLKWMLRIAEIQCQERPLNGRLRHGEESRGCGDL
jgi:hypothetical protein